MGFSIKKIFRGGGGGGGVHTPVEAKETGRSKQLVKIIEVISEGEIEGLADDMKSVYFDNTPVQNSDDTYNFKNVALDGTVGELKQYPLPGFNLSEKEISVGARVRKVTPLTHTITDSNVTSLRLTLGVQSLFKQENNGDTNGTSVDLVVYIGDNSYPITISGKYSSQYLQQHTFTNLPSVPFTVRVERKTDDSTSQRLQNNTIWSSYTEIISTPFTYPHTAYVGIKFDSEYFSNLPTRTYDIKGIKLKVPSNYNPETREYKGLWDGTFKIAWSDNPAWVLYDIVTNKRYGLGERVGEMAIDKWTLYQVAQYCDQLVPDGFGGTEPRFTCNAWLTEQRAAYDVINDICSIFRAMPVWNGRELTVVMDRPADPVWTYTNANVENGEFTYTFSAKKSRHNAIQVEYADKDNAYEKTIEYVSDDDSIRKNGLNVKKVTAFGCTSRGQAHRTGLWLLQTEKLETKTVSFTVGAEGLMHIPGDIIKVADVDYAGTNIGGRVLKVEGKKVTLDREINPEHYTANSYFTYINEQAKHQDIKILSVKGAEITLERSPVGLVEYGVWSLSTQTINTQLFRALTVKEEEKGKYSIVALQHEPQKEAIVDNGAKFEPKATSILPSVGDIYIDVGEDGKIRVDASVSGGEGTVLYDMRLYKAGNLVEIKLGQKSAAIAFDNLENGDYVVVIQAKNERGQLLSEQTKTFTIDRPPAPQDVKVFGGLGNITLSWAYVNEATMTEIFAAETDDVTKAKRIAKVNAMFFSHEVGAKQVRYYWLRHTRGINAGPFSQQDGLRGESAVDIDAELEVLNKKLAENIVDEVIDTALPARNLEMIKTVEGLNVDVFLGYNQVHNTTDGKLYTWNGSKYVDNNIDVGKLVIPTTQLSGQISAEQIAANTIGTQHLGANVVTADNLAANSVTAGALQAGAVRAEHIASSEVTADKLAIGLGGNLLYNPIFANGGNGWAMWVNTDTIPNQDWSFNRLTGQFQGGAYLETENQFRWQTDRRDLRGGDVRLGGLYQDIDLQTGKYYCFSAYVGGHRVYQDLNIELRSSSMGIRVIKKSWTGRGLGNNGYWADKDTGLEDDKRIFIIFQAVGDSGKRRLIINQWAMGTNNSPFAAIRRPMLEECTEHTREPSPWQNAGVTAIHGGSIVTKTITAQQIAAGTVTANEIAANTITGNKIASRTITANQIATKSLTANEINVGSLSAISANLGSITAGSLRIGSLNGNYGTMFEIQANGGFRLVSRSAEGGIELSSATRALHVWDGGTEAVRVGKLT